MMLPLPLRHAFAPFRDAMLFAIDYDALQHFEADARLRTSCRIILRRAVAAAALPPPRHAAAAAACFAAPLRRRAAADFPPLPPPIFAFPSRRRRCRDCAARRRQPLRCRFVACRRVFAQATPRHAELRPPCAQETAPAYAAAADFSLSATLFARDAEHRAYAASAVVLLPMPRRR